MKSPLEIPAHLVHRGERREVVALGLESEIPGLAYLRELRQFNPKGYQILAGQIRLLCDTPLIRSKPTFKLLDPTRQLFEFKTRSGLRLYCFPEGDSLILLTNGGKKNTAKQQDRDIQRAKATHDQFKHLIQHGATLRITVRDEDQIR